MLYIAIALTMLALMGGILLVWKVKADAMGAFAKWMAYLVVVISLGMLLCELGQTCVRLMHCRDHDMAGHPGMQYCPPEMCGGKACWIPMGGCCMKGGGEMECGHGEMECGHGDMKCGHGDMKCGDEEMEHDEGEHAHEHGAGGMEKDTTGK